MHWTLILLCLSVGASAITYDYRNTDGRSSERYTEPDERVPKNKNRQPVDLSELQRVCGIRELASANLARRRTVGVVREYSSKDTPLENWPWMVKIVQRDEELNDWSLLCGGAIITRRYILTAAHCFSPVPKAVDDYAVHVFSYEAKIQANQESEAKRIDGISLHPDYNPYLLYNDIAVVRLRVGLEQPFMPVCLPKPSAINDHLVDQNVIVIGYGSTFADTSEEYSTTTSYADQESARVKFHTSIRPLYNQNNNDAYRPQEISINNRTESVTGYYYESSTSGYGASDAGHHSEGREHQSTTTRRPENVSQRHIADKPGSNAYDVNHGQNRNRYTTERTFTSTRGSYEGSHAQNQPRYTTERTTTSTRESYEVSYNQKQPKYTAERATTRRPNDNLNGQQQPRYTTERTTTTIRSSNNAPYGSQQTAYTTSAPQRTFDEKLNQQPTYNNYPPMQPAYGGFQGQSSELSYALQPRYRRHLKTRRGGPPSYSLREASITVISSGYCSQMYNKTDRQHLDRGIVESQLCAGNPEGGVDSCQGDSGGPLMKQDSAGRWRLVGIVSFGDSCSRKGYPGVYTKVAAFNNYIEDAVDFTA